MDIAFANAIPEDADTVLVAVEEGRKLFPSAQAFDETAGGAVGRAVRVGRYSGKKGEMLDILAPDGVAAERIVAVGAGDYSAFEPLDRQKLGGDAWAHLNKVGARRVAVPTSSALDVLRLRARHGAEELSLRRLPHQDRGRGTDRRSRKSPSSPTTSTAPRTRPEGSSTSPMASS